MKLINFSRYLKSFIFCGLLSHSVFSHSDGIGDQLDALIATGAYNYEPYASVKLNIAGRHAFSLPRMRFNIPTQSINLVQFTPPSINTSCSSISLNLGNFSFISLDEAISALRSIAAQSITYGFGQAVQALCQPCWATMRDLQNSLQKFNQAAKNTCYWAEKISEEGIELFGDNFLEDVNRWSCRQMGMTVGSDDTECQSEGASWANFDAKWLNDAAALGIDPNYAFVKGNSLYVSFERTLGGDTDAEFSSAIPSSSSKIFFGYDVKAPEVAMTLFGFSKKGEDEQPNEKADGWNEALIKDPLSILTYDPSKCDDELLTDCLTTYECVDTPNPHKCMVFEQKPLKKNFDILESCEYLRFGNTILGDIECHVQNLFEKMSSGTLGVNGQNISKTQRMLLSTFTRAEQAVFYIGSHDEKAVMSKIANDTIPLFLAYTLLHDYLVTVKESSLKVMIKAKSIEGMSVSLEKSLANIDKLQVSINDLAEKKSLILKGIRTDVQWQKNAQKYSKSAASLISKINQTRG